MPPAVVESWWIGFLACLRALPTRFVSGLRLLLTRRGLLMVAGLLVCVNAVAVLVHVQSIPDLGLRSAFSPYLKAPPRPASFLPAAAGQIPAAGDRVEQLGDQGITTWADLMSAPRVLSATLDQRSTAALPAWASLGKDLPPAVRGAADEEAVYVKARFSRDLPGVQEKIWIDGWCELGGLPLEEMVPTVLWFFLKFMLFSVGALVLWKRPGDRAATLFFLLCLVTLGAYMGGYHWPYISSDPLLQVTFIVCGTLLPVVSLHFYLVFPRPKRFLLRHPRRSLAALYCLPVGFMATLVVLYFRARWAYRGQAAPVLVESSLDELKLAIYAYLGVAALYYLASIVALVHSYRTVTDITELNQVKWILFGAALALVPIGYSLYLAFWDTDAFGAGKATWPMFAASVCLTVAFTISITRYRLMELDKIITSGAGYFFISFVAALIYYAVVFLGTLVFHQFVASPTLAQALTVSTTALVLMIALDVARSRFKRALDRRFYREKNQLDRTLQRLGQAVQQLVDPPTLANRLLHASAEILSVTRGAVYLREQETGGFRLAGSLGDGPPGELPADAPLAESLQGSGAVTLPTRSSAPLSPAQRQLTDLGGEAAVALVHEGRLLAILVLGPKDRPPYQADDLNLLAAFAQITALALDSADGHRTIEALNRDLQEKVQKIGEQQRRILALQAELRRQTVARQPLRPAEETPPAAEAPAPPPGPALRGTLIGGSPRLRQVVHLVQKVAENDRTVVLLRGESGTGKELLAQLVHDHSPRRDRPFVKVHCAALTPTLLESELFGHVKGAFTGAHKDKVGRFELAEGGTLLLDEIGDVSLEVQTKLLRVLQERTFERVGSSEPVTADVRILAATHQDLEGLIRQGRFRMDLFYRLNVFPIVVPPLRDRREDVPELVEHFLRLAARRCGKPVPEIDDDAMSLLKQYPWPGNVRELENVIERAVVIADGPLVTADDLPQDLLRAIDEGAAAPAANGHGNGHADTPRGARVERQERHRREREQLLQALRAAGGNKAEAARALGLARSTLVSRLKKLGIGD